MTFFTKRLIILVAVAVLIATSVLAEIGSNATGYDWLGYAQYKKYLLIGEICDTGRIDRKHGVENIAEGVDAFYYGIIEAGEKGLDEKEIRKILNAPCIKIIPIIINRPAQE